MTDPVPKSLCDTLRDLAKIGGISGDEERTANYFAARAKALGASVATDRLGNVLATVAGKEKDAPVLLIDSHADEIGFLVSEHCGGGFLKLKRVGGMDPGVLPASEIVIRGEKTVRAVVAAKPPHLMRAEDRKKKPMLDDLYVDTLLSEADANRLCPVGTPAGFADALTVLQNGRVASRGLDDRVSGACFLRVIELCRKDPPAYTLKFLFSVQEEIGGLGAETSAFGLTPDLSICVDVGFAAFEGGEGPFLELARGPGISYSDTLSRTLTDDLVRVAREENLPFQLLAEPGETGTNAHEIQVSGRGVPSTVCSIPLSYMHSPAEVADLFDVEQTARLLHAYAQKGSFAPKEIRYVG